MKLLDVLLLSLAVAFVIIAIYETMAKGIGSAYLYIMVSLGLFFFINYRKLKK